jgi:MATE family multidrug resistance protein
MGRNDAAGVRHAGLVAAWLGILLGAGLTLLVIVGRFAIARFFLGATSGSADATLELAATLLLVGATFFVTDGLQSIMAGSLRGMKDTRIPLMFAAVSYWLIGFPAAWGLAFPAHLGAVGVWIGLSLGTLVYATLLVLRFFRLAHRLASA